jgi:hypothetical protein
MRVARVLSHASHPQALGADWVGDARSHPQHTTDHILHGQGIQVTKHTRLERTADDAMSGRRLMLAAAPAHSRASREQCPRRVQQARKARNGAKALEGRVFTKALSRKASRDALERKGNKVAFLFPYSDGRESWRGV